MSCKTCQYLVPLNNLEPIIILEPGGSRRPDIYAYISVEEDDEEKEEDEEEKKENYEKEKEMEGKRRDEEDMQDTLVVEEGRMVKFPLVPSSFHCISCCMVLSAMKKLNNHIVYMHKDPSSCILC